MSTQPSFQISVFPFFVKKGNAKKVQKELQDNSKSLFGSFPSRKRTKRFSQYFLRFTTEAMPSDSG